MRKPNSFNLLLYKITFVGTIRHVALPRKGSRSVFKGLSKLARLYMYFASIQERYKSSVTAAYLNEINNSPC